MDVSNILASHAAKYKSIAVEKDIPIQVDPGFLAVTDLNPIDETSYNEDLEEHLQSLAREGVQALFSSLFSLPTVPSPNGPLAQLPPPTTQLPRAKPLPKPKPKTKWELFAAAKGIQKKKRDRKVWDEERQEWVDRWGKGGKNKQVEEQWITEVPLNADVDYDPRKVARDERKQRVAKNTKQHAQNVAHAMASEPRKKEIEKTLATARVSTASMGKFDRKLEGERRPRGVKRKFDPTEKSASDEAKASMELLSRLEGDAKKMKKDPQAEESVLNVRKVVRFASKGRRGLARGNEASTRSKTRARRGKSKI